jgi:hypothetical protein
MSNGLGLQEKIFMEFILSLKKQSFFELGQVIQRANESEIKVEARILLVRIVNH